MHITTHYTETCLATQSTAPYIRTPKVWNTVPHLTVGEGDLGAFDCGQCELSLVMNGCEAKTLSNEWLRDLILGNPVDNYFQDPLPLRYYQEP